MKKVVLMANQNTGCDVLRYLHDRNDVEIKVVIVYPGPPKPLGHSSVRKVAKQLQVKTIEYQSDEDVLPFLIEISPFDILMSVCWRNLISKELLEMPKIGAVNFHNSILPKYRGVYANAWPIEKGEKKSGVSLHWMTEQFDDGGIIMQVEFNIDPWDTAKETAKKVSEAYKILIRKAWPCVEKWKEMTKPQKGEVSYFSAKDFFNSNEIDLNKKVNVGEFVNYLRARSYYPEYQNVYFRDTETGDRVYLSIILKRDTE